MASESFKQAYGVLQQHAQTLRNQQEPNIDDLLTIVTESVQAYKVCQQRIEAVEKALKKALSDTGAPAKPVVLPAIMTPSPSVSSVSAVSAGDVDDIPF